MLNIQSNKPIVSVITCLYNTPPELFKECLNGLISQTFKNFEVLIVNDGSDKHLEENLKIIESFNDDRFIYYDKEHSGKSQTLNFALSRVKGKYIAINDSDDVSYPQRLEYQYLFLENNLNYDAISNAMKSDPTNIIFPGIFDSGPVNEYDMNYKACHPSMMFKANILENMPFLFEQIYDSMEDNVFNHIMFHDANVKFYYDNKILVRYSCKNPDAVHYQNLQGYKREGSFKLFHRTFNKKGITDKSNFTCILLVNQNWKEEIEKTILNIKFTADNVKILISVYNNAKIDEEYYNKYDVKFIYNDTYINALINGCTTCETEYLMVISKPIRFYSQNWDIYVTRYFEANNKYLIVQPHLVGIEKLDRDNYYNENGKEEYKLRCGQNFILLDNVMTEKRDKIDYYSEYTRFVNIPILDDDLIFITNKNEIMRMQYANGFNNDVLLDVFLSLKEWLQGGNIQIDTDIKCGVIETDINEYTPVEYSMYYYLNMWKIAYFFLNETKFIYEKIIHDNVKNLDDAKYIINSVIEDKEFNDLKNNFVKYKDMSYFLKNINLKYNIWSLTNAI